MKDLGATRIKHLGTAIGVTKRKKLFHPVTTKSVSTSRIIKEQTAMSMAAQTRTRGATSAAGIASITARKKRKRLPNKYDDKTGKYKLNTPSTEEIPAQKTNWGSQTM